MSAPVRPPPLTVPEARPASTSRIVTTLTLAGVLAGAILVTAFRTTLPAIERHRAETEREAAREVLRSAPTVEILYDLGGRLAKDLPAGASSGDTPKVFLGRDAAGRRIGFALRGSAPGYADAVTLLVGYDPATKRVLGMKVLEMKETPGLGDRVKTDPAFARSIEGREAPLVLVKPGKGTGDPHEVDAISGATISSRAVVKAIDSAVARWQPLIDAWLAGEGRDR